MERRRLDERGDRSPATENKICIRDLQREPLFRPRIRYASGRQRDLFRRQDPAPAGQHAGIHPELSRCEHRRDRHRSAVSRWPRAEFDHQGLDRPFARRPRRQARRTERRPANGQVRGRRVVSVRPFRQRPRRGDRQTVRRPRDGAYRLRYDSIFLALRHSLHDLRQHLRHRGHPLDAQRRRHHRRQSGETQWVKHPSTTPKPTEDGFTGPISGTINGKTYSGTATTQGPPLVNDPQPWWGSEFDDTATGREPTAPKKTGARPISPRTSPSPRWR